MVELFPMEVESLNPSLVTHTLTRTSALYRWLNPINVSALVHYALSIQNDLKLI